MDSDFVDLHSPSMIAVLVPKEAHCRIRLDVQAVTEVCFFEQSTLPKRT